MIGILIQSLYFSQKFVDQVLGSMDNLFCGTINKDQNCGGSYQQLFGLIINFIIEFDFHGGHFLQGGLYGYQVVISRWILVVYA